MVTTGQLLIPPLTSPQGAVGIGVTGGAVKGGRMLMAQVEALYQTILDHLRQAMRAFVDAVRMC